MTDNKEKKVRVSDALLADLRKFNAEETEKFHGARKEAPFGELLERAWAVYRGRPEPAPSTPEDETVVQLKEILAGDKELCEQVRHFVRTIHGVLRLRRGIH